MSAEPAGPSGAPAHQPLLAREAALAELWGPDCPMPGGGEELVRLASVFGPSPATTLLLVGARDGAPARCLATAFGAWVAGVEADPWLLQRAERFSLQGLPPAGTPPGGMGSMGGTGGMGGTAGGAVARRASVTSWQPASPAFRPGFHHHALALEPLAQAEPAQFAAAVATALKPYGGLVLLDLVAEEPLDPAQERHWRRAEGRLLPPPTETQVTRSLGRAGFDVRAAEDLSGRHQKLCMLGWRALVGRIAQSRAAEGAAAGRPSPPLAAALVSEAERWLWRMRLMRDGRLRLVRWYAIGSSRAP